MFVTLEKIAQVEPKYVDIVLLENYAAFQHRFFSLFFSLNWCAFNVQHFSRVYTSIGMLDIQNTWWSQQLINLSYLI